MLSAADATRVFEAGVVAIALSTGSTNRSLCRDALRFKVQSLQSNDADAALVELLKDFDEAQLILNCLSTDFMRHVASFLARAEQLLSGSGEWAVGYSSEHRPPDDARGEEGETPDERFVCLLPHEDMGKAPFLLMQNNEVLRYQADGGLVPAETMYTPSKGAVSAGEHYEEDLVEKSKTLERVGVVQRTGRQGEAIDSVDRTRRSDVNQAEQVDSGFWISRDADRLDAWQEMHAAKCGIHDIFEPSAAVPNWMDYTNLGQAAAAALRACTNLKSATNWSSHRSEVKEKLSELAAKHSARSSAERERRATLWSDALREISVSNDRLFIFLRTLAGTLHETIDAVIEVNDSTLQRSQEQERTRRAEALRRNNDFSNRVMQSVFGAALRSAKLDFGMDGKQVVVMSQANLDEVRRLAEGETELGFFDAAQRLQQAVAAPQGLPLAQLMEQVAGVLKSIRDAQLRNFEESGEERARVSYEYLSAPRNSYTVRLKAEASAAIRTAWSSFCVEWAAQHAGRIRRPLAYEAIEGADPVFRNTFATYCAYQLSHSRIFSSTSSVYVSRQSTQTNMQMLRITLIKLINRGVEYVRANPQPPTPGATYASDTVNERNPWGNPGYGGGFGADAATKASMHMLGDEERKQRAQRRELAPHKDDYARAAEERALQAQLIDQQQRQIDLLKQQLAERS